MWAATRARTLKPRYACVRAQGQAARWLAMGFGMFGLVAAAAKVNDKQASVPWTPREYPYDNLRVELGGAPK
jgi:hypothetical protein